MPQNQQDYQDIWYLQGNCHHTWPFWQCNSPVYAGKSLNLFSFQCSRNYQIPFGVFAAWILKLVLMWLWLWLSRGLWLVLLRISKRLWRWFLCEFPKCNFHVLLVSLWIWRISTALRLPEEYHHLQCYHERVWKSRRVAACIDAFWGPRTGCECLGVLYSFPGADYGTNLDGNKRVTTGSTPLISSQILILTSPIMVPKIPILLITCWWTILAIFSSWNFGKNLVSDPMNSWFNTICIVFSLIYRCIFWNNR